ncbi:ABC transporter [Mesorhizobium sp. LSHC440B00]|uniref:ABC transporter ATP-binding protein n=1 Tax=unclassified Mesorhizobium TaxID=325217 RepID=UPI0003CE9BC0|nr:MULTISPECIES: ABC transporter ATP-binding protein [unclassified Mesorhizobium]ESX19646.1 ABC transporter [Mesorhizobium sp. LSHC440B00]ESX29179.1 ABC transporter [Mesorhizobium sp. LSHC440A00]
MTGKSASSRPLLQITGLTVEVRENQEWRPILKGVDLTLQRGEILGLIGESGAGKSTIGLAALGYPRDGSRFAGGSIRFDGQELIGASERKLRALRGSRVAYVAQSASASFNPAWNLFSQYSEIPVKRGLKTKGQALTDAQTMFRTLLLPNPDLIGLRYPHQVSGGQLQRAMIAMAMACQPELIVFDEPTTALDVTTQVEVLTAIKIIVERFKTAALYISHDLAVVTQIADRIMVMRHGANVEEGETRQILDAPHESYTKALLAQKVKHRHSAPSPTGEPLLRVNNVSAAYARGPNILENVSLEVGRKQTVAVVGESGSGKSSLARAITGLLTPSKGIITLDGKPLSGQLHKRSRADLKRIQMIYQSPDTALNPRQQITEVLGRPLEFYRGIRGKSQDKHIASLLEMIDLNEGFARRFPGELSGGEKQRICIARALAAEPELIICDEVTSALDQLVAQEILRLLQRLQQELSTSFLFITHDLATVKAIADDIVVMQNGVVVDKGSREAVLKPPMHPYTDLLLSSEPKLDPNWLTELLAKRASTSI